MSSVNKVILVGHLGSDPVIRYSATGDAICNFSLATSERWKDKATGEQKEQTEWHRIVMYRRQAEVAGQYLKKGSQIYLEGSLRTRKWTDKEGIERYTTEINGNNMTMLGGKQSANNHDVDNLPSSTSYDSNPAATNNIAPDSVNRKAAAFDDLDDDIPF